VTPRDADVFKRGIEPLANAHKLGALLCQFPASFKRTTESVEYLISLLETFADYGCAVELRHRSWSDDFGPTLQLLNAHQAAFVQIDEPKFKTSIRQNQLPNITSFYYLRAHGRNFKKWWHHDHKDERYDYLYKPQEIKAFGETLKAVSNIVRKAYAYMNNHANAQAIANAIELKNFLKEPIRSEFNPDLLKRYPELKAMVPVAQEAATPVRRRR
jgi:uncharacterized protein YecE (DUF72 family)